MLRTGSIQASVYFTTIAQEETINGIANKNIFLDKQMKS